MKQLIISVKTLVNRIKSKQPSKAFPDHSEHIQLAFEVGGVKYYQFTDPTKTPPDRYFWALLYHSEAQMNCDKNYLLTTVDLMKSQLRPKNGQIDIGKIGEIINKLEERLQLAFIPDLIWKIASVMYFDQSEQPHTFDTDYAEEKIKFWKENTKASDFFLQMGIEDLIGSLSTLEQDLETYTNVAAMMDKEQTKSLYQMKLSEATQEERENIYRLLKRLG